MMYIRKVAITEEVYAKLEEIKTALRKERDSMKADGYSQEQIDAFVPRASYDGAIRKLLEEMIRMEVALEDALQIKEREEIQ